MPTMVTAWSDPNLQFDELKRAVEVYLQRLPPGTEAAQIIRRLMSEVELYRANLATLEGRELEQDSRLWAIVKLSCAALDVPMPLSEIAGMLFGAKTPNEPH